MQLSRIALCLFFGAIVPGVPNSFAQASYQISQEVSHLDNLLNQGEYERAGQLAKSILERMPVWERNDQAVAFLANIGKTQMEIGRLGEAVNVLGLAQALSERIWNNHYEARQPATQPRLFDFPRNATTPESARRIAKVSKPWLYCTLLRIGKLSEAEILSLSAVKECPKKAGKYLVSAPRVLYAASIVESHLGNYADEAYCRRGLEIAAHSKRETRDLSLGYLALAEALLQASDLPRSHEAALKSTDLTRKIFGTQHQDMVSGLGLLAQVIAREGNATDACARAKEALHIATGLFGSGSPGLAAASSVLPKIEACSPPSAVK